ncbi:MAG: hypothetical protein MZU95_01555 [Desulfomicrobium escambiense]|nr:hypothetical protein [Desulfomicrobium escambiense]
MAVLATGVDFGLQKKLGLSAPREFLKGAQVECSFPGAGTTTLFFGRDVAPGAFAWSVPSGPGRARVGVPDPQGRPGPLCAASSSGTLGGARPLARRARSGRGPSPRALLDRTVGDRVLAVERGGRSDQDDDRRRASATAWPAPISRPRRSVRDAFDRSSFGRAGLAEYERRWKGLLRKEILIGQHHPADVRPAERRAHGEPRSSWPGPTASCPSSGPRPISTATAGSSSPCWSGCRS